MAALWPSDSLPLFSSGVTDPRLRAEARFPWDELLVAGLVVYLATAMLLTLPEWLRPRPTVREATES